MTNLEFSDEFDVLYNNITSNQAPGLDEYEKSVFLTKALDEIIKAYFNPKSNKVLEGFDGNLRRLIDFSRLLDLSISSSDDWGNLNFIDEDIYNNAINVSMPSNALLIINEQVKVNRGDTQKVLLVVPISYIEYNRLMSKPFKRPLKNLAWRVSNMGVNADLESAFTSDVIIGIGDVASKYTIRYVKRPNPIILSALEGVTIGGYVGCDSVGTLVTSDATQGCPCELDPILHHEILQRAVELAKAAYTGDLTTTLALGQASETEKGFVQLSTR